MKIHKNPYESHIVTLIPETKEEEEVCRMFWEEGCIVAGASSGGELDLISLKIWRKSK